jgi:hypothetical protein
MIPPLSTICRRAYGYCRLASRTEEINSPAFLPLGENPTIHNNGMLSFPQILPEVFEYYKYFLSFLKFFSKFR